MADITDKVRDSLVNRYEKNFDRSLGEATERQREIARQQGERRSVEGMGRPVMEVDNKVYQEWVQKEGKEVWRDPKFRKWIGDRNPELKARSSGTGKVQVGYGS
jgi:hypothetical protein